MAEVQTLAATEVPKPEEGLPAVSVIRARDFEVECPKCGHIAEAWVRDPRGTTDKCDECGTEYRIPGDVEIRFA